MLASREAAAENREADVVCTPYDTSLMAYATCPLKQEQLSLRNLRLGSISSREGGF